MTRLIDISVPLQTQMPTWPGSSGFRLLSTKRIKDGDSSNDSRIECDIHAGTHMDAPRHFLDEGRTAEELPLEILIGDAAVVYLPDASVVDSKELDGLHLAKRTSRLLLRTRNSELWAAGVKQFKKDYVALTPDAAEWVVDRGIRLIGVDYLSVQRYGDGPDAHRILLGAGVVVLEGLRLSGVQPGSYELICLPLCIVGAEGAPARAVLRRLLPKKRKRS